MRVVVLGGTGRTGRRIAEEALARGHQVRVVGRSARPETVPAGADPLAGDVTDPAVVERALEAADAVVTALSIPRASGSPFARVTGPADLHSRSAALLVEAMSRRGVRRLVKISAQGVGPSAARAGWAFRALVAGSNLGSAFADHARADEVVRGSGLDWTIAHPPMLADGPGSGRVEAGEDLTTGSLTRLARADLARWIVDSLEDPTWFRRAVTVRPAG